MLNIPTLQEQLVAGGSFTGTAAGGPIDMGAARTGVYVDGGQAAWHQNVPTHVYQWCIIAGAAGLLVLISSRFGLGPVNV